MSNNTRGAIGIVILSIILAFTFALNRFEDRKLVREKEKLEKTFSTNISSKNNKSESYSNIIKNLTDKKNIQIERVTRNSENKILTIDLRFKGDLKILDEFLKNISNKESLYKVNSIKLKKEDNHIYTGYLILSFKM